MIQSSATLATSPVCDSAPVVPNSEEPDSQLQSSSSSIDAPPISAFTLEIYDSEFQSPLLPNTNVSPDSTLKIHDTNQHNSVFQYPPASTSDDFISEIIPNKNMINAETYSLSEKGTVEQCEEKFADLADLISGNRAVESLSREQIYRYYTKHFITSDDESLFTKMIQKKDKKYTLTYQLKWLHDEKRSWHVYIQQLCGGLCKACILFDGADKNRGIFVKNAYQDISKPEKIAEHEKNEYHQKALAAAKNFIMNFEDPTQNIDFSKKNDANYEKNLLILKRIIEAVLLCAEQGFALRGHRDHHQEYDQDDYSARSGNRGNFIAIFNAFARIDPILKEHLEHGN